MAIPEEFQQEVRITRETQSQPRQRMPIERRRPALRTRVYNPHADLTQDIRDRSDVLVKRRRTQNRLIRQAEALGYNRVLRRNRLLSNYDLANSEDYIAERRNLGTFADDWSREYARANRRLRRVPFILFKYLNTERTVIAALREMYAVMFQYDLSVIDSELPGIDEFDVGEGYRADIARRAIQSHRRSVEQDECQVSTVLDPNYLWILHNDLGQVATFIYRILGQRNVRAESIQVLFQQGEKSGHQNFKQYQISSRPRFNEFDSITAHTVCQGYDDSRDGE